MGIAGAFGQLVARLFQFSWSVIAPSAAVTQRALQAGSNFARSARGGLVLTAGAVAVDLLNIDMLRQEAVKIAPRSDPEALEEAARQIIRMTGADGTQVMWPRGTPRYFVMDLVSGRQWFTTRYINFAWVRNANRRGFSRGIRAGQRQLATISQAQNN